MADAVTLYRMARDGTQWRNVPAGDRQPTCPVCRRALAMTIEARMEAFIRVVPAHAAKLPTEASGQTYHRVIYHAKCKSYLEIAERPRLAVAA